MFTFACWIAVSTLVATGVFQMHRVRGWELTYSGKLLLCVYVPWLLIFLFVDFVVGPWEARGIATVAFLLYSIAWQYMLRRTQWDPLRTVARLLVVISEWTAKLGDFFDPPPAQEAISPDEASGLEDLGADTSPVLHLLKPQNPPVESTDWGETSMFRPGEAQA